MCQRHCPRSHTGAALALILLAMGTAHAAEPIADKSLFNPGALAPTDSRLNVHVGQEAPDFELPAIDGKRVRLSDFRSRKNVVISFVPAAWTPVCSSQWPGYDLAYELFEQNDAVILGITVDNAATLHAWTVAMKGLSFPVLSDFWPHGAVADTYGVLRSDGTSERALFVIDRTGVIRYIDVHDINERPDLGVVIRELRKLRQ